MKIVPMEAQLLNYMGSDLTVVNAARVSFHKTSLELSPKDDRLIRYLAEHKHFSPFNHCFITFRIKAPIFVARQLVKHKFLPWNEVSRRYVSDEPEVYLSPYWRKKSEDKKQGSDKETCDAMYAIDFADMSIEDFVIADMKSSIANYNQMIDIGVCPEQARMVLPQAMMTEWWWSGTLGAYADMLKLRLDPHTQQESREVAEMIRDQLMPLFPISLAALLENK